MKYFIDLDNTLCFTKDSDYINFSNNILLKHNRLHDHIIVDSIKAVYIFDK